MELSELRHVLGVPPCIVVGGQDAYGKVLVVTRLLAEQVLPIVPRLTPGRAWRPVRLKHSHARTVCLALPDHGSHAEAGYELVHSLHAHARPWGTVPRADVELDQRAMQVGWRSIEDWPSLLVDLQYRCRRDDWEIASIKT